MTPSDQTPQEGRKPHAYRVLRDRLFNGTPYAKAGDTVYDLWVYDYGCASDDTYGLGIEHRSVTRDPSGGYPFFTIPAADLERASQ